MNYKLGDLIEASSREPQSLIQFVRGRIIKVVTLSNQNYLDVWSEGAGRSGGLFVRLFIPYWEIQVIGKDDV